MQRLTWYFIGDQIALQWFMIWLVGTYYELFLNKWIGKNFLYYKDLTYPEEKRLGNIIKIKLKLTMT